MKTMRLFALPAIAGAALLTMTGCFQLPGAAPTPTSNATTTPTDDGGSDQTVDLAGTSWSGTDSIGNQMTFTLNQDNTVDFSSFNTKTYDAPSDTWSSDGTSIEIVISGVPTSESDGTTITYTGTASTGSMSLSGSGEDGASYSLEITQG